MIGFDFLGKILGTVLENSEFLNFFCVVEVK